MFSKKTFQPCLCRGVGFVSALLIILMICTSTLLAVPHAINIDGRFPDWDVVDIAYEDGTGDGGGSGIDFGRLRLTDDSRSFLLQIEVGIELNIQENNNLVLYLDTDDDDQTGLSINGIGAELEWNFGERSGTFYYGGSTYSIEHADIKFVSGPTVTSATFEIAIGRGTRPDGSHLLFNGTHVKVYFQDNSAGGDELPEAGQTLSYVMDNGTPPADEILTLNRNSPTDLRIITYNVLYDSPWDGGQGPRFGRQLAAVSPDILSFQEIYDHSSAEVADFVSDWVEPEPGESWYAAGNNDCHTVSRYPILGSWGIDGNQAVLIDASTPLGSQLLVINAHLPCCSNDSGRQEEVDHILSFIRDAKEPGGTLTLPDETPILIIGDMNFVGLSQQIHSLLTGDIVNEGVYGEDFTPDWDDSDLMNTYWQQTERRMGYTWRNDYSSYWPGHLDYMIYTDAVLEMSHHFVIYTPAMSPGNLAAYGMQSGDSEASDHLLCCADFYPADSGGVNPNPVFMKSDLQILPNPSTQNADLVLHLPYPGSYLIEVFDITGRKISRPLGSGWTSLSEGTTYFPWSPRTFEGDRLKPGTYLVKLRIRDLQGGRTVTTKWTYLR